MTLALLLLALSRDVKRTMAGVCETRQATQGQLSVTSSKSSRCGTEVTQQRLKPKAIGYLVLKA